jgi:signal transduction histidine kinase
LQATSLLWLGFLGEGLFQISIGVAMATFVLFGTVRQLERQNQALQEAERQAHDALAAHERLQAERIAHLEEMDRLKRDFLNAASHELRTPLTSIMGYAEFLEDGIGGALTEQQHGYVSQIKDGAERLRRIVDDMLDFARLEAGTFQLTPQLTDMRALIQSEAASLLPQATEKGLSLELELPHAPVLLQADPRRVGQVLLNLLTNAIKFTPEGGRIRAGLSLKGDAVRVSVSDTGIGVAPDVQPRLFEKFFQVDPSTTREYGGAGLGLAISKALIEAHGGTIGLESEPGRGSTFWFTLPMAGATSTSRR